MAGVFVDRSLHYLVTKSTIKSPADLRGKTFVINAVDLNGSTGLVFQAMMRHFGLRSTKTSNGSPRPIRRRCSRWCSKGWPTRRFSCRPGRRKRGAAGMNVLFRAGDVYSAPLAGLSTQKRTFKENPGAGPARAARADSRDALYLAAEQRGGDRRLGRAAGLKCQRKRRPARCATSCSPTATACRAMKKASGTVSRRARNFSVRMCPLSEVADFSMAREIRSK